MAILGLDKRLMASTTRRWMVTGILAGGMGLLLSLVLMSIVGRIIDGAIVGQNLVDAWLPFLIGILVCKTALGWLLRVSTYHAAEQTKTSVRDLVYQHALRLGAGLLGKKRTGELVNMSVDGMEWLEQYYGVYFVQFVIGMSTPIVLCVYIALIDWVVGVALIVSIPLTPMFLGAMGKQFAKVSARYFELQSHLSAQFLDSLQGMPTLKMFNQGKARGEKMYVEAETLRVDTMRLLLVNQVSIFLTDWGFALGSTVVMAVAALWRMDAGALSPGEVVALLLISAEFARPLNLIGAFFFAGAIGREVANNTIAFLDEEPQVVDAPDAQAPSNNDGSFELRDLNFTYEGAESPALDGVSFRVAQGETVALVGPSGAGKSTVTHLLMRSFAPSGGGLLVGGHPVEGVTAEWVRAQFAMVSQDPYLFYGSFVDNMRVAAPDATQEQIEAACKAARLHEFIESSPQGYDTLIGERGYSVSGGQAQRLAIARALLKDSPFVILDEPTSQIDSENEHAIQAALDTLTAEKTVLLIAHRLSTVAEADRIVVLDGGKVVEAGTPEELSASQGAYARMIGIHRGVIAGQGAQTA